jgi:hypothetical protein
MYFAGGFPISKIAPPGGIAVGQGTGDLVRKIGVPTRVKRTTMLALTLYAPLVLNRIMAGATGLPQVDLTTVTGCLEALMLIAALWHLYHDK